MIKNKKKNIANMKITKEMIKNNPFFGSSFREHLKEELEKDPELRLMFEKRKFLNNISDIVELLVQNEKKKRGKNISVKELVEEVGLSPQVFSRLKSKNNFRFPSLELLYKVAKAFGKKLEIRFV